jgi:hypothetical protein
MDRPLTVGISDAQRAALATLADRLDPTTYLAGGMAIALRFGHRSSRDLDLFTTTTDPGAHAESFLDSASPVHVVSRAEGTLHLEIPNRGGTSLDGALGLFRRKYVTEDVGHVVKSLAYFADADASPLPAGLSVEEWHRIQSDFRSWVSRL